MSIAAWGQSSMILLDGTYYIFSRRMFGMTNFRDWTNKFYAFSKTGKNSQKPTSCKYLTAYYYLHCQNDTLVARIGSRKGARTLYSDKRGQSWNLSGKQSLCSRKILRIQFSGTRARTFDPVQNRRSPKHEHLHGRQTESRQTHRPERVQIDRRHEKMAGHHRAPTNHEIALFLRPEQPAVAPLRTTTTCIYANRRTMIP